MVALQGTLFCLVLLVVRVWRSLPGTPGARLVRAANRHDGFASLGELGMVVGDVAGSGLSAAVIMGRLRSALRAYALEFPGPADVLGKLDRKMQYFEEGEVMATVSYAVLDPDSGQLRVSSAGHFPPVIAAPGQRGAVAQIAVDPPIGVADVAGLQVTTLALAPGAVLCFFTDGLVERLDAPIDDGITRLCQAVTPGPPEGVCVSMMHALVGSQYPGMTSPF